MTQTDFEWPITPEHERLMAKKGDLSEPEGLCLAIHEVAYSIRGVAIEHAAAMAQVADAVYAINADYGEEGEEDSEDDAESKGSKH